MTGATGQASVRDEQGTKGPKRASVVKIEVEGRSVWALVDSGADASMISQEFAQAVVPRDSIMKGTFGTITQAGGQKIPVTCHAEVTFQMRAMQFIQPMVVIPGLIYQVVLGRDFCCQHKTVLDDKTGVFRIGELEIPLPTYTELRPQRARVVTCSAFTVPARAQTLVHMNVEIPDGGVKVTREATWQGVLEPRPVGNDQEWRIPRVVGAVTEDATMPVQVTNVGKQAVTIPPGTEIGTLFTIQEDGRGLYDVPSTAAVSAELSAGALDEIITKLNIEATVLSETGKASLEHLVTQYSDIFSKNEADIGKTTMLEHRIETGDAAPVRQSPRRIPMRLREEVERQKEKMLQNGIIEESSSPWRSPIVLAKKKDGSFRFCVDLRAVNAVTQSLPVPLPRVDDSLDNLAGAQFFSTLDMASGYWQVDVAKEHREKTAFSTGKGLHQFRAMPFGLKNAGATFQRLMELVLAGMDSKSCLVYIDDVIVFGETEHAHLKHLEEVFERIRAAGMKLKPQKCCLARDEVVFLGHKVGKTGVQPDPANINKVRNWPRPKKADELKSFLGLAGYYSRFVPNYSDLVRPVREAAEKKGDIQWDQDLIDSFESIKVKLTSAPILALPTCKGEFKIATDASNTAVGAVLTETVDGREKVVAYASKVLNKSERRWPTYDKELWAIVWAIRHFRQYLAAAPFTVLTDHKPLKNIPRSINVDGDATGRRGRWAVELSTYDLHVHYRKGSDNGNADAMSRQTVDHTAEEEANDLMAANYDAEKSEIDTDSLRREQDLDPIFSEVKKWMTTGRLPAKKELRKRNRNLRTMARLFDQLTLEQGIMKLRRHGEKNGSVILLPQTYRETILKMLHDDETAGHLGTTRTLEKAVTRFFWPGMTKDVSQYCDTCEICQRRGRPTPQMQATLRTDTYSRPFERVGIDITEMPVSARGNKYALVAMDYFTKYVFTYAMPNQTAETVSECLFDMVLRQGVPERLHSDQGRQFESAVFQSLCKRLGIEKTRTSPYRPESDGMVERFNRTLKDMSSKFIQPHGSDWDDHLASITFAYNTSKHSVTGFTPFFLVHGREARLPVDELFNMKPEASMVDSYIDNKLRQLRVAFSKVQEHVAKAASDMTEAQRSSSRETSYVPGQRVWVKDHTANVGGKRKLALYYKGPATVIEKQGSSEGGVTYKVSMPGGKETNVHHNHLKPVKLRERGDLVKQRAVPSEQKKRPENKGHDDSSHGTIIRSKTDQPLSGFVWMSSETSRAEQPERPTTHYVTRYGRISKPPVRYPE